MKRIHERELDGVDEGDGWEQEEEEVGRQEGGRDGGEEEGRGGKCRRVEKKWKWEGIYYGCRT